MDVDVDLIDSMIDSSDLVRTYEIVPGVYLEGLSLRTYHWSMELIDRTKQITIKT